MSRTDSRLVFLSVPESLRGRLETLMGGQASSGKEPEPCSPEHCTPEHCSIDPSIPIPVELPPGETELNWETFSREMILSGMIRASAEFPAEIPAEFSGETPEEAPSPVKAEWINYYRRFVLAVKPNILKEFTEASILKAKNGDYPMALEITAALEGLFPGSPVVLLNRALILEDQADALERSGREAEAEEENLKAQAAYERVLSLRPPFPNGFFNGGFFFMKRQNFEKARECFSAYIPLSEDPEKKERAEIMVKRITDRGLDEDVFREAYECIRRGDEEEGLLLVRDFLERHSDVRNGWFLLGWALRRLGRWEDGAASFRKALELGSNDYNTRNELAICLMEMGDYQAARRELERALRKDPENVKIISNLGVLAKKQGYDDEAAGFFRTVLELEPEDPIARQYLAAEGD
ncbi:MAG: tetratricopeptide repeat protein [Treponema sp.]|jgi:tetratricopeptide (TPR) repeat protein|nr:tetratricopeptide repeat protein [Treponema sp.]